MPPTTAPRLRLALHWWILIALALGVVAGLAVNLFWTAEVWKSLGVHDPKAFLAHTASDANISHSFAADAARFVNELGKFIGDLFIRLLRLVAVPVVLFSLLAAVGGVGSARELGRLGARTLGIFALTAVLAVLIAFGVALSVQPGRFVTPEARDRLVQVQSAAADARIQTADDFAKANTLWSQVLDVFPANPFNALATGNVMQVVMMAVLFGVGLTLIESEKRRLAVSWCEAFGEAGLKVVGLVLLAAPLAVFCMTAAMVGSLGWSVLTAAGAFMLAVVGGLALICYGVYPLAIRFLTPDRGPGLSGMPGAPRITVRQFLRALAPAQVLAFSSSSSAATMPVTMQCCDALRLPRRVTNFVVPLGTTVNMDGTALYQVMCVTFLAQLFGVDLSLANHFTIGAMAILVAIGSPGLPGASLVLMVFILEAVNIPAHGIAIILAVDRLLDMARTVVNVTGDAAACVVVARGEREPPGAAAEAGGPGLRA